jgi:hypothetical protein
MAEHRLVTGLFPDRHSAERAVASVTSRGYDREDVNLVMSRETRRRHFTPQARVATEVGTRAAEGAGIGGAIGGTVGAVAAAFIAMGTSLSLPGLGVVVAGPLAAALAGAGACGAAGGLVGALIGWGIPEEHIRQYELGIREGNILMGVLPRTVDDAREFERSWRDADARLVYS